MLEQQSNCWLGMTLCSTLYTLLVSDSHALVHFHDESTSSIIPLHRIVKEDDLHAGDPCFVVWSNKKKYPGILIFSGTLLG